MPKPSPWTVLGIGLVAAPIVLAATTPSTGLARFLVVADVAPVAVLGAILLADRSRRIGWIYDAASVLPVFLLGDGILAATRSLVPVPGLAHYLVLNALLGGVVGALLGLTAGRRAFWAFLLLLAHLLARWGAQSLVLVAHGYGAPRFSFEALAITLADGATFVLVAALVGRLANRAR